MKRLIAIFCALFSLSALAADPPVIRNYFSTNSSPAWTVFDVTDFGAKADMTNVLDVGMTSGSASLTTVAGVFTAADLGKIITIPYAGGGGSNLTSRITNIVSGTSIVLSNAAVATVSAVTAFYGTDDTAAIQNVINLCISNTPVGGTIYFPGISLINGPIQDPGVWTNHHNSQLIIPPVTFRGVMGKSIVFQGPSTPSGSGGESVTNRWVLYGGGMWSTMPRGASSNRMFLIDCRNFTTPSVSAISLFPSFLNGVRVDFRDMLIGAAFDADIGLLNVMGAINSAIDGCVISQGPLIGSPDLPVGTNSFAILASGLFNDFHCVIRNTRIGPGFYAGIDACDSTVIDGCLIMGASNAITCWQGTANPISIDSLILQDCANQFYSPAGFYTYVDAARVTIMDNYGYVRFLMNDAGNAFFGQVEYTRFIGDVNNVLPDNGGNRIGKFTPHSVANWIVQMPITARNGRGDGFGTLGAIKFGADYGANTVTAATRKWGAINTDSYSNNLATPIVWDAFNLGNSYLYIGGYSANAGATEIRLVAGSTIAAQPNLLYRITSTGLIEPFGQTPTLGGTTLGMSRVLTTNLTLFTTSATPVSVVSPVRWKDVTIEGVVYKIPLYQ